MESILIKFTEHFQEIYGDCKDSFKGARLGDTRKPDVCVYYGKNGFIIDNKAYSKGYSLPMNRADEMVRHIEENKAKQSSINTNQW